MKNHTIKERIQEAAIKVFQQKGYTEGKITEIAAMADVSLGTIYNYFKGKRDLFNSLHLPDLESIRPEYDKKRLDILRTALSLFDQKGYTETSMDEIAEHMGFTKAVLYKYFNSKEDLFCTIVHEAKINLTANDLKAHDYTADFASTIKRIAQVFFEMYNEPERPAILRCVICESNKFPELGRLFYEQGFSQASDDIAAYFEKMHRKGYIKNINLNLAATSLLGVLLAFAVLNRFLNGFQVPYAEEDILSVVTSIFIDGLKA